jgi:hypothetical protein
VAFGFCSSNFARGRSKTCTGLELSMYRGGALGVHFRNVVSRREPVWSRDRSGLGDAQELGFRNARAPRSLTSEGNDALRNHEL